MPPWRRGHVRLASTSSLPRPASVLRRSSSRLVALSALAAVCLTTYALCSTPSLVPWASDADLAAAAELFALEGEGVMGGRNATERQAFPAALLAGLEDERGRLQKALSPEEEAALAGDNPEKVKEEAVGRYKEALPVCQRTVLFRFAGRHGFGSELSLFLRVATLAEQYGYAVFTDTSEWNYGAWTDYFVPTASPFPLPNPSSACRPPEEAVTRRFKLALTIEELQAVSNLAKPIKPSKVAPKWTKRDHVVWSSRDMDGLDFSFLRLLVDRNQLNELHKDDLRRLELGGSPSAGFLSPEETVPAPFEKSLVRLSALAGGVWQPNDAVAEGAEELASRLSVPRSAGKKRVGELLVAVHVRLGDKFLEADRIGPVAFAPAEVAASFSHPPSLAQPGLSNALITSYYAAIIDSINSLLSLPPISPLLSSLKHPSTERERVSLLRQLATAWTALEGGDLSRPTLALMSDDPAAVEAFRQHPLGMFFRLVGTTEAAAPTVDTVEVPAAEETTAGGLFEEAKEDVGRRRLRKRGTSKARRAKGAKRGGGSAPKKWHVAPQDLKEKIPAGFNEVTFNSLPLSTRLASTRLFVRDLTVLTRRADAIVMTGSSNVGRLMLLLFEAARREKGIEGRREVRSLDTRWFPTARFS
ncbi:hypothetical protein JCM8097_006624 [Rhodosporidiobolus ruineniae]